MMIIIILFCFFDTVFAGPQTSSSSSAFLYSGTNRITHSFFSSLSLFTSSAISIIIIIIMIIYVCSRASLYLLICPNYMFTYMCCTLYTIFEVYMIWNGEMQKHPVFTIERTARNKKLSSRARV